MTTASAAGIAPGDMRRAMGQFATGVTVVTSLTPAGEPAGCTVSAFSSLSLDPPLVLACLDRGRPMLATIQHAGTFAVNVLRCDQKELARAFARPGTDRFADLAVRPGLLGLPLIEGCIAHVECVLQSVLEGGDHLIIVGEVRKLEVHPGAPLLYTQGTFLDPPPVQRHPLADAPAEWLLSLP